MLVHPLGMKAFSLAFDYQILKEVSCKNILIRIIMFGMAWKTVKSHKIGVKLLL